MVEFESMESVRILCPKLVFHSAESGPGIHWLVGSPFFPPLTIVSSLRCIHNLPSSGSDPTSPDLRRESGYYFLFVSRETHQFSTIFANQPTSLLISKLVLNSLFFPPDDLRRFLNFRILSRRTSIVDNKRI